MNNLIPIYYHVPKCGGTYFYHMMSKMSEEINPKESHCIHVHDDVDIVFRIIILDDKLRKTKSYPFLKRFTNRIFDTSLDNLDKIFNNFNKNILLIVICSRGFNKSSLIFKELDKYNLSPKSYMTIRNTFERFKSLYNYLLSDNSEHEKIDKELRNMSFENLIKIEPNWITSRILGINRKLIYNDYLLAIDILEKFYIRDLKSIDDIIKDIYTHIYNIDNKTIIQLISKFYPGSKKNESIKKHNTNFQNLSKQAKLQFLNNNRFDIALYAYFTQI